MPARDVQSPEGIVEDASQSNSPAPNGRLDEDGVPQGIPVSSSNKRKRAGGSSARGVANLTPEQLERKRANDREAQRAIRERTKQQIDRLNEKIRELESSQPYRDLQVAISQKDAVEAENAEIKRQLTSFISVFRSFVPGAQGLEDLAAAAERNAASYHLSPDQLNPLTASHNDTQSYPLPPIVDHTSPHIPNNASSPSSSGNRSYPYPNTTPVMQTRGTWPQQPAYETRNIHPDLAYPQSDERLGVEFILDNSRPVSKSVNGISPGPQSSHDSPGAHSAVPQSTEATCPLDAILLDAVAERQRLAATGATSETVVGPRYPNFNALMNKNTTRWSHPMSRVFTDIMRTFPDLSTLPEQVAVTHIMFLVMRWEVEPSKDNYELLPEWCRPVPSQLFTPHPCWLDYLPWPRLRDNIVRSMNHPHFDTFFIPYTTSLSVNWPYSPSDVLLPSTSQPSAPSPASTMSSNGDEPVWRMNPAFETHIRNLANWSLGPAFRESFPQWAETVRIKESTS